MLSANSWLSLAVMLVVLCSAQALEPSLMNNSKLVGGFSHGTRCSWNCTILDSDFLEEIRTEIAKKRVIHLVVKYEKKVDDKCVNQTSHHSSGNITEHWQIWMPSKQLSVFAKALESVEKLMFFTDSNEDRVEIGAICTLRPVNMTAAKATCDSGSFPIFRQSHLADLGVKFDSIDTETTDNLQRCKNITKLTGNNSSTSEGPLKRGGWPVNVLVFLNFGFVLVFLYYSPAFLCFFSPTEITEDGVHQIVLDGASPVSLRSLMGNYFFSEEHRVRMFVLRALVLPFPFFGLAIFTEYLRQNNESLSRKVFGFSPSLFHPFMIVSYVCYYIMVGFMSFSSAGLSRKNRLCIICKVFKSKTLICQENLPKQLTSHLRIQPLILVECSRLFIRHLLTYFKRCFLLIPSAFEFSSSFFLPLLLFIVLLFASPAATVILLILTLLVIFIALSLTCPLFNILSDVTIKRGPHFRPCNDHSTVLKIFLWVMIKSLFAIPALLGASLVLLFAGVGVDVAIVLAFVLLLTKESLPFAACSVLVLYYLWSSYSSFTNKYQDLGFALFKHYKSHKTSRHSQLIDMSLDSDLLKEKNTQNVVGNKDNVIKIPKELFQMAYEELMPIRESVCVLILKVTLIVSFVLFVFSLIMLLNVSATPVMRAFLTFASGSLPKIVAIYMDGKRQKNIETLTADEKIPLIVQKYIEAISAVTQGQENSGADIYEEKPHNVNDEENIQLVIM